MAKQFQLRRGTTLQNSVFIGAEGEVTVDTEKHVLHIHDGVTPGGYEQIYVVDFQEPTEENGWTWYKKYNNGWVEQGGNYVRNTTGTMYLTLPIEMADTEYTAIMTCAVVNRTSDFTSNWTFAPYSTTQCQIYSSGTVYGKYGWRVSGMGA